MIRTATLLLASSLLLLGCGVIPTNTSKNVAVCPIASDLKCEHPDEVRNERFHWQVKYPTPRARASLDFREWKEDKATAPDRLPPAFVGIALSGGGSRAANFSMAVLHELNKLGFLQHATAISSTSGGGLAGAYYALHGSSIDWKVAKEKMGFDFLGSWISKNLNPVNLLSVGFTHRDRSDLMSEVFDEVLFDNAIYGDLKEFGAGRPLFIANATSASYNQAFRFEESKFDSLGSRLDKFPISQAVMASAAFPGVFNSVTLRDHVHPWKKLTEPPRYTHLIDGGPSDNLGLGALKELAARYADIKRSKSDNRIDPPCFIFLVDAFATGNPAASEFDPDPRGALGRFVDPNFFYAFDTLLGTKRADILQRDGLLETDWSKFGDIRASSSVDFDGDFFTFSGTTRRVSKIRTTAEDQKQYRCLAWHINLSGIEEIPFDRQRAAQEGATAAQVRQTLLSRVKVGLLSSQTDTNFRLVGPKGCSSKTLQEAIFLASSILVRGDTASRRDMCKAFADAGLQTASTCSEYSIKEEPLLRSAVRYVDRDRMNRISLSRAVECFEDIR